MEKIRTRQGDRVASASDRDRPKRGFPEPRRDLAVVRRRYRGVIQAGLDVRPGVHYILLPEEQRPAVRPERRRGEMTRPYDDPEINDIPDEDCGPAMKALAPMQRRFVVAWLALGSGHGTAVQAAKLAGYGSGSDTEKKAHNVQRTMAYKLSHDPAVLAAIQEEAFTRMRALPALVVEKLVDIATNEPDVRVRAKVLLALADRVGFHAITEQHVKVEDVSKTDEALAQRLNKLLQSNPDNMKFVPKQLMKHLDPKLLPAPSETDTQISDAEFTEVDPDADLLGE